METVGAVVLTGGTARRLGGVDKAGLELGGRTLLERALALVADLPHVVVGDPAPGVPATREQPPGGGPAAALLAGVEALAPGVQLVLALAVDMPLVGRDTLARLRSAAGRPGGDVDGALLVDAGGRAQYLCAAYRRDRLTAAAPATPAERDGLPLRRLLAGLRLVEVPARGREAHDIDTRADLERVRTWLHAEATPVADPPAGPRHWES